jgi:lysophospholipase L1-like esterase
MSWSRERENQCGNPGDCDSLTMGSLSLFTMRFLIPKHFLLALVALPAELLGQTPQEIREQRFHNDWAYLERYRRANAELPPPIQGERRVVFMGNSITEQWAKLFPVQFPGKPYIGRGISGQTTAQMLIRFRPDVIALSPEVVVILAGTNDIAGNTGVSTLEMIEDNIKSMTELAHANGIKVVLCSVLPVFDYPWKKGIEPASKVVALNAWLKKYAAGVGAVYVDFHTPMADARQGLRPDLGVDGVHPNEAGYGLMAPLVVEGIAAALKKARLPAR